MPQAPDGEERLVPVVGAILFLTAIHYLNFMARMALAPLLPFIENDLGLGHAAASSLFLFISVGYCAGVLGSGFVAATLTHRHNITLSALLTGAALVGVGLSGSLWSMRLFLLAMGAAAGLYFPSGVTVITTLASPRHWGKALGIHELAPSLGLVSVPLVAVALLDHTSWRGMMLILGGCLAASGLFNARFGPSSRVRSQMPDPTILLWIIRQPSVWILTALLSLAIGSVMGVYAILPLYLISERGMDPFAANLILSLSRIAGLGTAFLGGWAGDRLGLRRAMAIFLVISGLATSLLALDSNAWLLAMIFLQGAVAPCFAAPALAALSRTSSPQTRSLAISLAVALAVVLGGGFIPAGLGLLGQLGSFKAGFFAAGLTILAGLILLYRLRLTNGAGGDRSE